jgi:hypothetical protein
MCENAGRSRIPRKRYALATLLYALATTRVLSAQDQSIEPGLIDVGHDYIYDRLWRAAMGFDHLFGSPYSADAYQDTYGSLAPALLWDRFHGLQAKLRFQINAPLPGLSDRVHAVIGRFNPDEFITEQAQSSGSIRRQFGTVRDDETIFGLAYHERKENGSGFGASTGVRTPLDPYVKGDYSFVKGDPRALLLTIKQTLFWQVSEHLGTTSRLNLDHFVSPQALLRFTTSGTVSQKEDGVRGFAAVTLLRSLSDRRALAGNLSVDWQSRAPVTLRDYGAAVAYRQRTRRKWLILEVRSSVNWPKEVREAPRAASFGVGVGVEMLFGTTLFQARPVTF